MFFLVSKIFAFFTVPSNVAAVLAVAGLALLATRFQRIARQLVFTGITLLVLFGYSPLGDILLLTLSERFPPWTDDGRKPDGIIVLGGAISPEISAARAAPELNASSERITAGVALSRRFPDAKLVFSGGSAALFGDRSTEAAVALDLWTTMGIPRERILLEARSRNTVENAIFTRDLVQPKPDETWLLVTSAYHMPRSVGVFRAAGFHVVPYPVDWRTRGWSDGLRPFATLSGGLSRTDTAIHEWIGLVVYRLTGRTADLLPGPKAR